MREQDAAIESLLKKREVKKAEILIAKYLKSNPTEGQHAGLLVQRARTRLLTSRPEAAVDDLLRAKQLSSDLLMQPRNLELLADCYFARFELSTVGFVDRGDAQQAELLYQRLIDDYPEYNNLGWVYYQLGRIYLTDNRISGALECFHQALLNSSSVVPLTAYCYERLGFVAFYEQREHSRSLTFLGKALDTYPNTEDRNWLVQVHILRSRVLREMHRFDFALSEAEQALSLANAARGGREERRSVLSEALLTTGELLSQIDGREKDLISHLEHFLQVSRRPLGIDVTWSRVYEMLGDAYFKIGRYDDAITAYNAVMQFNPYHPWEVSVYYRIARVYYYQGSYEKSLVAVQHALDVASDDEHDIDYRLYDVYGNAYFALGRYDKAATAYETALRIAPTNHDSVEKIRKYHQASLEMLNQTL